MPPRKSGAPLVPPENSTQVTPLVSMPNFCVVGGCTRNIAKIPATIRGCSSLDWRR